MQELCHDKMVHMKNRPIFKPVDFNLFFDLIQCFVQQALNNYYSVSANEDQTPYCPITIIDAQILFAGVLRYNFMDTQYLVQGINPVGASSTANAWTTWLMSNNVYADEKFNEVQLPLGILENIRSLRGRALYGARKFSKGNLEPDENNPQFILPVLGYYAQDPVTTLDYLNSTDNTTYEIWAPAGSEILPALHDGSYNNEFLDLQQGAYIQTVINTWNQWINTLQGVIQQSGILGMEHGILAFSQIAYTDVLVYSDNDYVLANEVDHTLVPISRVKANIEIRKKQREKVKKVKSIKGVSSASPFNLEMSVVTGNNNFNSLIWPYAQHWWRPSIRLAQESTTDQPAWSATNVQIAMAEPYRVAEVRPASNTITDSLSVHLKNLNHAKLLVNASLTAGDNAYTEMLKEAAKGGRGSLVSDVIRTFAAPFAEVVSSLL